MLLIDSGRKILFETIHGQRGGADAIEGRTENVRPGDVEAFGE